MYFSIFYWKYLVYLLILGNMFFATYVWKSESNLQKRSSLVSPCGFQDWAQLSRLADVWLCLLNPLLCPAFMLISLISALILIICIFTFNLPCTHLPVCLKWDFRLFLLSFTLNDIIFPLLQSLIYYISFECTFYNYP